jgi:hypothetical protein
MYSVPRTGQVSDTTRPKIFVVDAENPGAPKFVGYYFGLGWLDDDHILALDSRRSHIVTVSTATTRQFLSDSLSVWSFRNGTHLAYYDWHESKKGWWVVDIRPTTVADLANQEGEIIMPVFRGPPRKVSSSPNPLASWTSSPTLSGNILQYAGEDKVRLISFTGRKEELLSARFPGLRNRSIEMSRDGKEVVFVTPRLSSRLVLLEKVFK